MRRTSARMLVRLYPQAWRERYGAEFAALLEERRGGMGTALDVVRSAARERIFPTIGGGMEQTAYSFGAIARKPSALAPMAMSVASLTMVLGAIAVGLRQYGHVARDPDEGAIAHLFQLLMTLQIPVALFFVAKWLRRAPRQTLAVLGLQAFAWLMACAPVYLLHL